MYYYERTIVEIKNEYTEMLFNILSPLIYEGIKTLYNKAVTTYEKNEGNAGNNQVPNIFIIFQILLKNIPQLNNNIIEEETTRIKEASKCFEYFDDLIMAVFKSYIVLLTHNTSESRSELIRKKLHKKININTFIHKCYIESAKTLYDIPELFSHKISILESKRNHKECLEIIRASIKEAIRKSLPLKSILKEYNKNDFIDPDNQVKEKFYDAEYVKNKFASSDNQNVKIPDGKLGYDAAYVLNKHAENLSESGKPQVQTNDVKNSNELERSNLDDNTGTTGINNIKNKYEANSESNSKYIKNKDDSSTKMNSNNSETSSVNGKNDDETISSDSQNPSENKKNKNKKNISDEVTSDKKANDFYENMLSESQIN